MRYEILPLRWEVMPSGDLTVQTILGRISIDVEDNSWSYCFDEYYDEDDFRCDSVEACKAAAEEFYLSRLRPALKEV